jgi:flagellar biosynthesis protein FlhA
MGNLYRNSCGREKNEKKNTRAFSEQIRDYYNLDGDNTDINLDFIFSNDNKPDVILSSRDETVIALKYESEKMQAPIIKLKGKNEFAKRTLNLAEKNKIPVIKNDELTRQLYSKVSVNDSLPVDFYESIAGIYAELYRDKQKPERDKANDDRNEEAKKDDKTRDTPSVYIPDKLLLEIGTDLIPLVKYPYSPLIERLQAMRKCSLSEIGFEIKSIRIVDNLNLENTEYRIKINGDEVGRACINMYLVINKGNSTKKIAGEKTRDPAFGLSALWIYEYEVERAKKAGFGVFDPVTVIVTHISEICKRFSIELVGLDEVQEFIDCTKEKYPVVVNNMLKYYSVGDIKKVIHGLLAERAALKNIVKIFETLSDYGEKFCHDYVFLIEKVRQKLGRQICLQYTSEKHTLRVLTLEPDTEWEIIESGLVTPDEACSALKPADHRLWIKALSKHVVKMREMGFVPVVLCSEKARRLVKDSTRMEWPELAVLSVPEISNNINVELVGTISMAME